MTRVAVLTPPGTGAIATIAVAGPEAWEIVRQRVTLPAGRRLPAVPEVGRTWFGTLGDEVVIAAKPDSVEVHCHGGIRVVRWLVEQLVEAGCVEAAGRELPGFPGDSRVLDLLSRAPTLRTANLLLDQFHGAFSREIHAILDSPVAEWVDRIPRLAAFSPVGRHLVSPWKVVIAGPPNVGKSSIINALAGFQRSVVAPVAGTTRDAVTVAVALDGWPVELTDTAGIRHAEDSLEAEGIARARRVLAEADLVVWVLDGTSPEPEWPGPEVGETPVVVVNKADRPLAFELGEDPMEICVSATTGAGIPELGRRIAGILVPHPPGPGVAVPFSPPLADAVDGAAAAVAVGDVDAARKLLETCLPGR